MRSLGGNAAPALAASAGIGLYDAATGAPSGAGVYLLAFMAPDSAGGWTHAPYRHAAHYLGFSQRIADRIGEHMAGRGARLVQVVIAAGYRVRLVRTWQGTRETERALKNWHGSRPLCPLCSWNLAASGIGGDELLAPASPVRDLWTPGADADAAASAHRIAAAGERDAPKRVL